MFGFFHKGWEDNAACKIQGGSELRERCSLHRKTDICHKKNFFCGFVYKHTLLSTISVYTRVPKIVSDT